MAGKAVEVAGDADVIAVQVNLGVLRFDVQVEGAEIFGAQPALAITGGAVEARVVVPTSPSPPGSTGR